MPPTPRVIAPGRETARLLVVFENRSDTPWLRCLRQGFRHCFCVIESEGAIVVIDPLKGGTAIGLATGIGNFDCATHFAAQGGHVLIGFLPIAGPGRLTIRPVTCVEFVKRVAGVDAARVWTPFQLFRHLREKQAHGAWEYRAPARPEESGLDRIAL